MFMCVCVFYECMCMCIVGDFLVIFIETHSYKSFSMLFQKSRRNLWQFSFLLLRYNYCWSRWTLLTFCALSLALFLILLIIKRKKKLSNNYASEYIYAFAYGKFEIYKLIRVDRNAIFLHFSYFRRTMSQLKSRLIHL